jgi:plastocyanin
VKNRIRWAVLGLCGLLAACVSDTGPLENGTTTRTVHMQSSSFSPSSVQVSRGGSVTWVNDLTVAHDITPDNPNQVGAWTARKIAANTGVNFTFTFTSSGVYDYHCTIHSGMTGRITVN